MYEEFQIIISLTDILELLVNFGKIWELVLKWKCLISKIPHKKLILALLMEGQCFMYQKKLVGKQYLKVLRILVIAEILLPVETSA